MELMAGTLTLLKPKTTPIMKKIKLPFIAAILSVMVLLSSCQVVGGIFKAGVWVGIFIVVLIIAVIVFIASRAGKK